MQHVCILEMIKGQQVISVLYTICILDVFTLLKEGVLKLSYDNNNDIYLPDLFIGLYLWYHQYFITYWPDIAF